MVQDAVVRGTMREPTALLVIDTKWKVPSNGLPSDDDLQQMFVYNELLGTPRAILLYPETATSRPASGGYATKPHTCEQRHIGLCESGHWSSAAIKHQLADLLAEVSVDSRRGPVLLVTHPSAP